MLPLIRNKKSTPSLFDDFFGSNFWNDFYERSGYKGAPAVNVYEGKDNYGIEVAAPGLDKKDFHVDIRDNVLTISSEKKEEKEEKEGNKVVFSEFNYSSFSRSFQLPEGVDVNKISASHQNGILKISLPKREEYVQKAPRTIEISSE
jgi:HSP20 family protein